MEKKLTVTFNGIMLFFCALVMVIMVSAGVYLGGQNLIFGVVAYILAAVVIYYLLGMAGDKSLVLVLLGALAVGFALRMMWICNVFTWPQSDFGTMYQSAGDVAIGNFSPFNPGSYFDRFPHLTTFTAMLGLVFRISGQNLWFVKVLNVLLSTLCIYLVYLIGTQLSDKRLGAFCAILMAVFPPFIFYPSVLATENFAMPLIMLSLWFFLRAYGAQTTKQCVLNCVYCGLLLSFGNLFRLVGPLYLAAYGLSIFILFARGKKLAAAASMLAAFLVIYFGTSMALYHGGVTTYRLTDSATPFTYFFLTGFNQETGGMYSEEDINIYFECDGDKERMQEVMSARLWQRVSENPAGIAPLMLKKTATLWADGSFGGVYWAYEHGVIADEHPYTQKLGDLSNQIWLGILALGAVGVFVGRKDGRVMVLALCVLAFAGAYLFLEVQPRYTYSASFLFVPLASIGARAAAHKIRDALSRAQNKV